MTAEEQSALCGRFDEYQELKYRLHEQEVQCTAEHGTIANSNSSRSDGNGDTKDDSHPTPVVSYTLRVVKENGSYEDMDIDAVCTVNKSTDKKKVNSSDGDGTQLQRIFMHTVTGLTPNTFYVCLLCPYYGHDIWGTWTSPLKFMTQNLLQLHVTFMS
uniref:2-C-methyl-D-erythritol 4-phosphate cytidylyltransferase n=1 Tax=Lygus hesperus TaxID=30085 RepID=A0A0A9W334_LYGHE